MSEPQQRGTTRSAVVVDSDPDQVRVLSEALRDAGLAVTAYPTVEATLDGLDPERPPSLVAVKLALPGRDGWQLCRLLRSAEYAAYREVPILAMTPIASDECARQLLVELQANGCLASPADPASARDAVGWLLDTAPAPPRARALLAGGSDEYAAALETHGYSVTRVTSSDAARTHVAAHTGELALIDAASADGAALDLVQHIARAWPAAAVVVVTSPDDGTRRSEWLRHGATVSVPAPATTETLVHLCEHAVMHRRGLDVERLLLERAHQLRDCRTNFYALAEASDEALEESEAHFRELAESMPDTLYEIDATGRITFVNRAAYDQFGYTRQDLREGLYAFDMLAPADRPRAHERVARLMQGGSAGLSEYTAMRKDGSTFPALFHSVAIIRSGQPMGLRGFIIDITERKDAEEEQLRLGARVQRAQRLESLAVLAGGVAHDFNNLLMGILSNADTARSLLPLDSPARGSVDDILITARRAAELARQMLAYSGRTRAVVEPLRLEQLARETADLVAAALGRKETLTFQLPVAMPPVEADATQIRQVIMNLVTNASEALGDQPGEVCVSAGIQEVDTDTLVETGSGEELEPGRYAYVEVADTGPGLDEETRARMFDPFYSTKLSGRGLGLAAVLGIVRAHRGGVVVDSEPDQGARFRVLIPAADTSPAARESVPASAKPWRGSGTVLLVDDEKMVRAASRRMLQRLGFDVVEAEDGVECVDVFAQRADAIRIVLLDLSMPRMGGEEALQRLRELDGRVPVLLTSGYDEQQLSAQCAALARVAFIQKPYEARALSTKLRGLLELDA